MSSESGQGSLEYLLLIGGAILIGVVVFFVAQEAVGQGKSILETNLGTGIQAIDTAADNATTPLTTIALSVEGGDGKVIIYYSAPGANHLLLVQEKDSGTILPPITDSLNTPESFDSIPIDPDVKVFALPFYDDTAESGGVENGSTYHYRLRACNDDGTCLVNSQTESATPTSTP